MTTETSNNKKPVFEQRLNHIRLSVWANSGEAGTWFNSTITRRYKDNDEWKETNSFTGLADLALVGEAVRLAQEFITQAEMRVENV